MSWFLVQIVHIFNSQYVSASFLKISNIKVNGDSDAYNKVYESAKTKIEEWFTRYSSSKYLIDSDQDFTGFLQLKSEIRSHIVSDLIKNDVDQVFREPKDMDQVIVISAVLAEMLAVTTILKYKSHANLSACNFYFKNICNEDKYEVIKTR